ncbi:MAG TPA: carboxyltransferase domain-containing protein [Nocardioides sp.]|nr:carboxyltransferase domain-containing protein [Nocardioides sp.]
MISSTVHTYGEAALYVQVDGSNRNDVWWATHAFARRVAELDGVLNVVPTYDTIFVEFDITMADSATLRGTIDGLLRSRMRRPAVASAGRRFVVPVVYGGARGPDLRRLADHMSMSEAALVRSHTRRALTIRCLAGPLGGPMMSGPGLPHDVPRQTSPRAVVEAGSVLLAGRQSFIKTMDGPGGWQIIGATPLRLVDLAHDPLVPWRPGDSIQFRAIEESDWAAYDGARPGCHDD